MCPGEGVCELSQYVVLKTLAPAAEQAAMRQEHGERITLFMQADVGSSVISAGDMVRVSCARERFVSLERESSFSRASSRWVGTLSDGVLCRLICR